MKCEKKRDKLNLNCNSGLVIDIDSIANPSGSVLKFVNMLQDEDFQMRYRVVRKKCLFNKNRRFLKEESEGYVLEILEDVFRFHSLDKKFADGKYKIEMNLDFSKSMRMRKILRNSLNLKRPDEIHVCVEAEDKDVEEKFYRMIESFLKIV